MDSAGERVALYICNWSLANPLCGSQTLPYLRALAAGGDRFCLVTFERTPYALAPGDAAVAASGLAADGICWHPVRYHDRASLLLAVGDAIAAFTHAARAVMRHRPRIIHTRTSAPAAIGLMLARLSRRRFLYDADSELSEEYVDGAYWPRGGLRHRLLAATERVCRRHADAIVVLTDRLRDDFVRRGVRSPITVIPCCVDVHRFRFDPALRSARRRQLNVESGKVLVYVGKTGPRYLVDDTMLLAKAIARRVRDVRLLVVTHEEAASFEAVARRCGFDPSLLTVCRAAPADVPGWLSAADAGMALVRNTPSERGSSPIKISEYLASGLPVAITPAIGDMSAAVEHESLGVVVRDRSDAARDEAASRLCELWSDVEAVRRRCAEWARLSVDVQGVGALRYRQLYDRLLDAAVGLSYRATDAKI
jgi:glycosyltransferase involved in cell wall biosynthesis